MGHLLFHLSRNSGPIVADPNLDTVAKVPSCGEENRLVVTSLCLLALGRRVKTIRDQVENRPRYLSWEQINLACGRIERLV
jgi:hypothetical protein